jgi:hypothetical protein
LFEPQRTNTATFSESFDNAAWAKISTTVTANTTISPDGYTNADTIAFTASAIARCERSVGGAYESQSHTVSVYAKVASGTATFRLKCTHASVDDYYSSDLTATTQWQRFTFTQAFSSTGGTGLVYGVLNGTDALAKNIIFYGFQTEVNASYATSYIPTLNSAVTRGVESASKTGIASLIGQTEGTLYWEGRTVEGVGTDLFIVGNLQNSVFFNITSSNSLRIGIRVGNALLLGPTGGTVATNNKIALAYKSGDVVAYLNGVQVITNSTSFTFSDSMSEMEIAKPFFDGKESQLTSQALVFKTRLTNAQLAELTT